MIRPIQQIETLGQISACDPDPRRGGELSKMGVDLLESLRDARQSGQVREFIDMLSR